ncbi:MAG: ABC transporter permease [Gemmatimonadota bacterium]
MRGWWLRVLRLLRWRASEREIDEELRFHVEMEAQNYQRRGMGRREARRRALVALGGQDRWRERTRAARGTAWIEEALRDVRFALRGMARAPGFAVAVIATIALGVGATTAIYSVVDQVALSPLPFPEAEELVSVWVRNPTQGIDRGMTSWPNFVDWRESATTLEGIATVVPAPLTLTGAGEPERVVGASVSRGFFELIGAPLALGRTFRDDEVEGDFASVVVLSHEFFTRRFGADPSIVGQTIELDDATFEVVGVTEPGRRYPRDADLWIPQAFGTTLVWREPRGRLWLSVIGRLAQDVEISVAQQEMDAIAARLEVEYPVNRSVGITLQPLRETIVGNVRTPLLLLLGAVAVVLLIVVVNVANLLLARATTRSREVAARLALGAGRGQVIRQLLAHSAVLGLIGGLLGAALASAGVGGLVSAAPADLPRLDEVRVDGLVFGVALATALGASIVFGLVPALHATRVDPGSSLRAGARGASSAGLSRLRAAFVGGQFALAFVLLVGAGLLIRSFLNLRATDPGFDPDGVLSVSLSLPPGRYPDAEARSAFHGALLEDLASLPGVDAVGTISALLLSDLPRAGTVTIESRPDQLESGAEIPVISDAVSPGLFSTAGMDIVAGRGLEGSDGPDDPSVAVVNETFARVYLEGLDPVGERYTWGKPYGEGTRWFTIVGVVGDARRSGPDAPVRPAVFQPLAQSPRADVEVLVRTTADPLSLALGVRAAINAVDRDLPVSHVRTLAQATGDLLAQRRFVSWLLGVFALAAMVLAAVGIFGVMAYVVGRRTREIGIRVALGANRPRVLTGILGEGMLQAGSGLVVGTLASLALARVVRSQVFGLSSTDPTTFVAASALLLLVAALACMVPARRAASVDAVVALREE